MNTVLTCCKFLVLFAAAFGAAYGLRLATVPDVVAIADRHQPTWQIELAFVLDTFENLALAGAAITLMLALGAAFRQLYPPSLQT
jgi:hypothetical protein